MDKEKIKEYMDKYNKKYYQENKEKIKQNVMNWKNKNMEKVKDYKRKEGNSEKKRIRDYNWIKNNIERNREYKREWRKRNPMNKTENNARNMARRNIPLKESCDICHSTNNLQRHHWRYDKPLLVNTFCVTCHKIQHIKHFDSSIYRGGNSFGR